mmetsp:Transcript_13083/g.15955  ORF Transcript_13083/g.15955 Transcript_13083/m.15955 type:complete len:96 (+) Transcript_13083:533-820(+)
MLQTEDDDIGDFDLVIPLSLISGTDPSCTVLVQIEPEDATVLDFEGSNGAIGRFEADKGSGTLFCCLSLICILRYSVYAVNRFYVRMFIYSLLFL